MLSKIFSFPSFYPFFSCLSHCFLFFLIWKLNVKVGSGENEEENPDFFCFQALSKKRKNLHKMRILLQRVFVCFRVFLAETSAVSTSPFPSRPSSLRLDQGLQAILGLLEICRKRNCYGNANISVTFTLLAHGFILQLINYFLQVQLPSPGSRGF